MVPLTPNAEQKFVLLTQTEEDRKLIGDSFAGGKKAERVHGKAKGGRGINCKIQIQSGKS